MELPIFVFMNKGMLRQREGSLTKFVECQSLLRSRGFLTHGGELGSYAVSWPPEGSLPSEGNSASLILR